MNCRTYPGADCDTDCQLLVATVKVRLAKRQRQHSILPLNLDELKEQKAVHFAAEVINRFMAFQAAQDDVIQAVLELERYQDSPAGSSSGSSSSSSSKTNIH